MVCIDIQSVQTIKTAVVYSLALSRYDFIWKQLLHFGNTIFRSN